MVKRRSQLEHDEMVQTVAEHLESERFTEVKADLPDYDRPDKIVWKNTGSGHIPDVTADGLLVEVETADSIDDAHTEDQWTLFGAHAEQHNKTFVVVVPRGSRSAAQRRLRELGITAKVWTV